MICPWCEKEVTVLVVHPLPDDDCIEICIQCHVQENQDTKTTP